MRLRKFLLGLLIVAVVVVIGLGMAYRRGMIFSSMGLIKDSGDGISDYSAVFLTNGQVYFGKLYANREDKVLDLRDIYYLQVNQELQNANDTKKAATDPSNLTLVKLGQELHGPNDRMLINKDQVLFTESLKNDSRVVDAIGKYKK